jgi:hypothetical protein
MTRFSLSRRLPPRLGSDGYSQSMSALHRVSPGSDPRSESLPLESVFLHKCDQRGDKCRSAALTASHIAECSLRWARVLPPLAPFSLTRRLPRGPTYIKAPPADRNPRLQPIPLQTREFAVQLHVPFIHRHHFPRHRVEKQERKVDMRKPIRIDLSRRHLVAQAITGVPALVVRDPTAVGGAAAFATVRRGDYFATAEAFLAGCHAVLGLGVVAVDTLGLPVGQRTIPRTARSQPQQGLRARREGRRRESHLPRTTHSTSSKDSARRDFAAPSRYRTSLSRRTATVSWGQGCGILQEKRTLLRQTSFPQLAAL